MATNRRQQIQLSSDEQAAFFRERKKAALATIDKDGFPHVVAMNYVARDGAFYMTSYAKAQKVVNIRRNPKVALMIESGDEYAELRGVMIRGRCEILDDEASVMAAFAARAGAQANRSAWCSGSSRRRWSAGTTASSADDTDPRAQDAYVKPAEASTRRAGCVHSIAILLCKPVQAGGWRPPN
jgi:nitroimidazol reductase NimA-like FMN-containing flavoprotein (pyridoxamine 5'-phosphate oxidase superfamily)